MSISEEIKTVKIKKSATFIPLSAKKDGQISKLAEAQQREAKLQEEEIQENTFAFQQAKRADKASKNAMRFPRDHKDHEEAYTAHSDAHEAALSAAGHTGGYGYGSNNGMSHKMKQKYLKMATDHLDHMIHHTNKEFGTQESVQENVEEAEKYTTKYQKLKRDGSGDHDIHTFKDGTEVRVSRGRKGTTKDYKEAAKQAIADSHYAHSSKAKSHGETSIAHHYAAQGHEVAASMATNNKDKEHHIQKAAYHWRQSESGGVAPSSKDKSEN